MLDDRKAAILAALVEDHIATGAPVSSRAVLEGSGLGCSTATIRNEFVVLEQDGLIAKPHASAGRIPTDRGYRYYVDHLSPGSLLGTTRLRIDTFFATVHNELERILRETTDLLSDLTSFPAIVLGPGLRGHAIKDARVLAVEPGVALFILVTDGGRVHQALLRPAVPATPTELGVLQEILDEVLIGAVLADDTPEFETGDLPMPVAELLGLVADAIDDAAESGRDVYVGGTSRMVDLWEDLAKLHRILALLERDAGLPELLGDQTDRTTVRIGPETGTDEDDLAVVAASYGGGGTRGRMGVLGPLRMDYRRTIRVVEEISDALGDSLDS
ncbi:MAG: heat-inducible transcriptional repressor HrcA [Acidimicrobiia bacterium]